MVNWTPVISAPSALQAPPNAPLLFRGSVDWIVKGAADAGFEGIELHCRTAEEVDWGLLGVALKEKGMKLTGIGTGRIFATDGLSLCDKNTEIVSAAEARLRGMMDNAGEHGPSIILGVVRGRLSADGEGKRHEAYMRLVESYRRLAQYATKTGCRIVIEGINSLDADSLNGTHELLGMLKDVGEPGVLAHLDYCHMQMEGEDLVASTLAAKGKIGYVHFADSERKPIGEGQIDFSPVLHALRESGYKGVIGLEYVPSELGWNNKTQPDEAQQVRFAKKGLQHLRKLLNSIG